MSDRPDICDVWSEIEDWVFVGIVLIVLAALVCGARCHVSIKQTDAKEESR